MDGVGGGGGEEKINGNKQNKVPERARVGDRARGGAGETRLCALNGWKALNENDLAGTRRVGGRQVRPRSLEAPRLFIGFTPVPSSQNNSRSGAVDCVSKQERRWARRALIIASGGRHSAPALMEARRSPAFPHNWTHK